MDPTIDGCITTRINTLKSVDLLRIIAVGGATLNVDDFPYLSATVNQAWRGIRRA